jgi:uncharacterized membrane protein YtjA (UPF0391 family)
LLLAGCGFRHPAAGQPSQPDPSNQAAFTRRGGPARSHRWCPRIEKRRKPLKTIIREPFESLVFRPFLGAEYRKNPSAFTAFDRWLAKRLQRTFYPRAVCAGAHVLKREEANMLYYALIFLVVALVAGFLGFGGIAFAAAGIAKILFFIFLAVFLVTLLMHLLRGDAAGN